MNQNTDIEDRLREAATDLHLEAALVIQKLRKALLDSAKDFRDVGKNNRAEIYRNIVRETGVPVYDDAEVIGLDEDGCIIEWDAETCSGYNTGTQLDDYGVENLSDVEKARCNLPPQPASE